MDVVGWILWAGGLFLGLSWAYGVRTSVRTGQGVQQATVNQTMLMLSAVVAVPLIGFSPFHLVWLLPVAFIVGMLSLSFPFSLVTYVGKPFGRICCLGLDHDEVIHNTKRMERYRDLVMNGMSPEEAKKQLEREET